MKFLVGLIIIVIILVIEQYVESWYTKSDLQKTLEENFQANTFVKLDSLIGEKEGLVCVIGEYENGVFIHRGNIDELQSHIKDIDRLNEYFHKNHSPNDDFTETLAIVTRDDIRLVDFENTRFNIGVELVFGNADIEELNLTIPMNFQSERCVPLNEAYFYQVFTQTPSGVERKSIILGSKKQ
jgi:hypothetical protein